jgi:hypothetical protein
LQTQTVEKSSFQLYLELCKDRVGDSIEQGKFFEKDKARRELRDQSIKIADRLESAGVTAHEDSDVHLVGLASGESVKVDSFRQVNFIPAVAKKNRAPRVKMLEYFLDQPDEKTHLPNTHVCRMWVFNMGLTVGIDDIRERTETMQRLLSRFASEVKRETKIEFLFRSTEFAPTADKETKKLIRDSQGNVRFHVHAHVLVKCPKIDDWSGCLKWVNQRWRTVCKMSPNQKWHPFKDAGKIRNARELCKYVVKPADILQLTPDELARMYVQTFRLHTVHFLGSLQELKQELNKEKVKPVRRNRGNSWKWELMPSVNQRNSITPEDQKKIADNNLAVTDLESQLKEVRRNQVYALLHPSFYFTTHAEPAVLVSKYTGDLSDLLRHSQQCADVRNALLEVDRKTCGVPQSAIDYSRQLYQRLYSVYNRSKTVLKGKMDEKQLTLATHDPPIPDPF